MLYRMPYLFIIDYFSQQSDLSFLYNIIFFISLSLKIHLLHMLGLRYYDVQKPIK